MSGAAAPSGGAGGTSDPSGLWAAPVRALLLDVDDTLVDTRAAMVAALTAAAAPAWPGADESTTARLAGAFYGDAGGFFDAYTRGEITFVEQRRSRLHVAADTVGLPRLGDAAFERFEGAYREAFADAQRLFDDVLPLLSAADTAGVPVGLLTNSSAQATADKVEVLGLVGRVASVVTTDTLGVGKPDPRVFARAAADLGREPAETLVVGDTIGTDVRGGRAAGMRVAWLQRAGVPAPRDSGWGGPAPDAGVRVIGTLDEVAALL